MVYYLVRIRILSGEPFEWTDAATLFRLTLYACSSLKLKFYFKNIFILVYFIIF